MAICDRCGGYTKRKGICKICKGVYDIASQFNIALEEDKRNWHKKEE